MNNRVLKPITDFCSINMGQSPDSKTYNEQGNGIPFYQGNADFGEIHPKTRIWCSAPVKIANKGDILISVRAPIGAMNIATEKCCIGRGLAAITPIEDKCNSEYLFYALKSRADALIAQGTGSTFKAIGRKVLENTKIPDYDKPMQQHIADSMTSVEKAINIKREQLENLDDLIKARFVEMFGECKNMVALNDLCSIITDGTHQPPKFQSDGIPFIFVSNIVNNVITYNTEKFISEETYNDLIKRTPIEAGDILLSIVGSYGHPAIVVDERKFLFQRHIAYLKPKREAINSYFLQGALLSPDGQRQIEKRVKGIAQKTLNLSEIRKIMIPIPNIEEQNAFEVFVKQIEKAKAVIKEQLAELETLKKSLMQKYFG